MIRLELEALDDLINKYKNILDSNHDLYSYQKNVRDQAKVISDLQKQLNAYRGDTSEENRARLQDLQNRLNEAQENLQETEYERYISDQKQMLDDLYDEYEKVLNERLDDIDALVKDMIRDTNANASMINTTINSAANAVGYDISSAMENIWSGDNVVSWYTQGIDNSNVGKTIGLTLENIARMVNALSVQAGADVAEANATADANEAGGGSGSGSSSSSKSNNAALRKDYDAKAKAAKARYEAAKKELAEQNAALKKAVKDSYEYNLRSLRIAQLTQEKDAAYNEYLAWKAKYNELKGFAKGVHNLSNSQLAWTQENGQEAILRKSDGAILTPLHRGDSVLTASQTEGLYSFAQNPEAFLNNLIGTIPNGSNSVSSTSIGDVTMNLSLPNVSDYSSFVSEMKNDRNFQNLVRAMTVDQIAGQSRLKKYRV